MDKTLLKFFADVLYIKGLLCSEELDAIYEARTFSDLDVVFEKMMRSEFNAYKKGESYNIITPQLDYFNSVAG